MIKIKQIQKNLLFYTLLALGITLTNCSSDSKENMDVIAPILEIRSPGFNGIYSIGIVSGLAPETVMLEARAVDAQEMKSLQLTVSDSDGTIVFEKTITNSDESEIDSSPGSGEELIIVDSFETTNAGTYNVLYHAIDSGGNETTSLPRTFFYQD